MSHVFVKAWLAAHALQERLRREDGQAVTEYAIVLALIVVAAAAILTVIGTRVGFQLGKLRDVLPAAPGE